MKKLIALAALAAVATVAGTVDVRAGETFEVDDSLAEALIGDGSAKPADDPAPARPTKTVKARLLMDGPLGKANDVVVLSAADAKAAEAGGHADTSKEAVAYALTLPQNQPKE